jgi:hypothetical protein
MVTFSIFNFEATRRREIERHAVLVGVAETEDFDRHLIAWAGHNPTAADPLWSLAEAAKRMGGALSEAEAVEIAERASAYPKRIKADALGAWLGVTYRQRSALKLRTIGCCDIKKRARLELRKRKDRLYQARKRRERGARPRAESLSQKKPWEGAGIGRTKWYEQRRRTNSSAIPFIYPTDESVRIGIGTESFFSSRSPSPSSTKQSSGRTAPPLRADRTDPSAVFRPFQAIPRPPDYDPVAAFRDRMAARQHRRRA